ncbi:hypothetical protein VKT23_017447 [Stygiomarasmius scandens]|uniref:DUF6534 domain-containing protein n=1 Tax=Marasmiellus scandens TaxID=2682957 RepID=A0ABR1IS20_9AGAR
MCYYLKKSQGSEQRLNSKISTVMQYTLSSGLLTSAVSLSTLFTYTLMPNNLIFLGLQFLLTKFYVGSFLAMLNARHRPSNKAPGYSDVENGSHIKLTTPTRTQNSRWEFRVQTTVQTETFTESDIDPYSPQTMVADLERSGLSRTTTYASCQSDKAQKFDPTKTIDSSVIEYIESPASAVVPLHETERYIASPRERKPDYMTQW